MGPIYKVGTTIRAGKAGAIEAVVAAMRGRVRRCKPWPMTTRRTRSRQDSRVPWRPWLRLA